MAGGLSPLDEVEPVAKWIGAYRPKALLAGAPWIILMPAARTRAISASSDTTSTTKAQLATATCRAGRLLLSTKADELHFHARGASMLSSSRTRPKTARIEGLWLRKLGREDHQHRALDPVLGHPMTSFVIVSTPVAVAMIRPASHANLRKPGS